MVVFGQFSYALNFLGLKLLWSLSKSVYCKIQGFTQEVLTILENHIPNGKLTWGIWITYRPQLTKSASVVAAFTLSYVEGRPIKTSIFFPYMTKYFSSISTLEYNYGVIFFQSMWMRRFYYPCVLFVDESGSNKILV